jgi:hypothetical protein
MLFSVVAPFCGEVHPAVIIKTIIKNLSLPFHVAYFPCWNWSGITSLFYICEDDRYDRHYPPPESHTAKSFLDRPSPTPVTICTAVGYYVMMAKAIRRETQTRPPSNVHRVLTSPGTRRVARTVSSGHVHLSGCPGREQDYEPALPLAGPPTGFFMNFRFREARQGF